jgi:hypothetical protein
VLTHLCLVPAPPQGRDRQGLDRANTSIHQKTPGLKYVLQTIQPTSSVVYVKPAKLRLVHFTTRSSEIYIIKIPNRLFRPTAFIKEKFKGAAVLQEIKRDFLSLLCFVFTDDHLVRHTTGTSRLSDLPSAKTRELHARSGASAKHGT